MAISNPHSASSHYNSEAVSLLEFIQLLKQRYQTCPPSTAKSFGPTDWQQRIDQLTLAEAVIRKGLWLADSNPHPLHFAVIGPTQAGKSSLVNVLLQQPLAGVSPLAGHTVHAQGFCHGVRLDDCQGLQRFFGRFQWLPPSQLSKQRLDCFAVSESPGHSPYLPACVLWDTPDFDSIASETYREGVLRAMALADALILVVSKEKYADQTVWTMLATVAALGQPTVICLNKLGDGMEAVLIPSLREKWQQARGDTFPEVVPLFYDKTSGAPQWPAPQQNLLIKLAKKAQARQHQRYEQALLNQHWQTWLEPVLAEHRLLAEWQRLLDTVIAQAVTDYQRDYLNHPHHYETFQQAMAELLTLLELPGIAGFMSGARRALTWPMRQVLKLGRKRLHLTDTSQEVKLLHQFAEHALIQLADLLLDKAGQTAAPEWWQGLGLLLRRQRADLLLAFDQAVKTYHLNFQPEVEAAAQGMYHQLQQQPLVLNSLRATRVTADAAMVAMTVHLGGIGVHDLVIAPAMLAVTSMLAESAVGGHLHKVQAQLKRRQLQAVQETLFQGCLATALQALPGQLGSHLHFNIPPEHLQAMAAQLTGKRHGLRLL